MTETQTQETQTTPDPATMTPDEQNAAQLSAFVAKEVEAGHFTLPDNFKTAEDFAKSYVHMQREFTKSRQVAAQENRDAASQSTESAAPTPPANTESNPPGESTPADKTSTGDWTDLTPTEEAAKPAMDWTAINAELMKDGAISADTAKKFGMPDALVAQLNKGFKAAVTSDKQAAEQLVGGADRLQKIREWASTNLPKEELAIVSKQLKGEGWQFALEGLAARFAKATGTNISIPGGGGGPPQVEPWRSEAEMQAAIASRAYRSGDPKTVAMVNQRTAVTLAKNRRQ